jgi:putative flavoprotein involved in K+ transport
VKLPVLDHTGFPIQERGVTEYPGLYFVGMPWMPSLKMGLLAGVGEFAAHIASHIDAADVAGRSGTAALTAGAPT